MSVYVDEAIHPWKNKMWAHLVADTLDELHDFALKLGLKREWYQVSKGVGHYDITASKREAAIKLGAIDDREKVVKIVKRYRKNRR